MERLTELAQRFIGACLQPGDLACDYTAGNGWDTLFLAQKVIPGGKIYAFDLQKQAIEKTNELLQYNQLVNVTLFEQSHELALEFIPKQEHGRIAALMCNLGYLPGGDKSITTTTSSTIKALQHLPMLLKIGGRATIVTYPGHAAGAPEAEAVHHFLNNELKQVGFHIGECFPPGRHAPRLYLCEKCEKI